MSALHRFSLVRIALLIVGVVGVVIVVVDRASWMPGLDKGLWRTGISSQYSSEADSIGEPYAIGSDTGDAFLAGRVFEVPRPTPTPILHIVFSGESLLEIAANHGVDADLIARANDLWDPNRLRVGQTLIIPGPEYSAVAAKVEESGKMRMWWPLQGEITTYFGDKERYYVGGTHTGLDIAANVGAPARAAAAGKVVVVRKRADNVGWHIVIDHGDGWSTLYGHLSRFFVDEGDSVERGQVVGAAGDTGFSFGPHLHLEIRRWGGPVDPLEHLP